EKEEDLDRWQKSYGKDKDSKSQTVALEKFKVVKSTGQNLFGNGSFQSSIKGISSSGGNASWSSNKINGGSLQMAAGEKASMMVEIGSIKKNKAYIVEFKGMSDKKSALRVFFRYHNSPWEQVSTSTTFNLNPAQSSFQTILTPYEDVEKAVLIIRAV